MSGQGYISGRSPEVQELKLTCCLCLLASYFKTTSYFLIFVSSSKEEAELED